MIHKETYKVSIIIPCYNEKKTIKEILKKIYQSLKNYEISKYGL